LDDLLRLEPELLLHVESARRDEDVEPRAARAGERLGRGVDVLRPRAGERGDGGPGDGGGHRARALEVAGRGGGEPSLDDVDTETLELLGDLRLLVRLQRDARRLLAVAQRRVEDGDPAEWHLLLLSSPPGDAPVLGFGGRVRRVGRVVAYSPLAGEN